MNNCEQPWTKRHRSSKRQFRRLIVRYGIAKAEHIGYSVNVSHTGIKLAGRRIFPPDTLLALHFAGGDDVRYGRVMWARAIPANLIFTGNYPTMGIQFEDLLEMPKAA